MTSEYQRKWEHDMHAKNVQQQIRSHKHNSSFRAMASTVTLTRLFTLLLCFVQPAFATDKANAGQQDHMVNLLSDFSEETALNRDAIGLNMLAAIEQHSPTHILFRQQKLPQLRMWKELASDNNACVYNKINTPERERIAIFSQYPLTIFPPIRLISFTPLPMFDTEAIDFEAIPVSFQMQIGTIEGRSYGENLDRIIKQYPQWFYQRNGTDSASKLVEMLFAGRVDAILEYSQPVEGYFKQFHPERSFHAHAIKDNTAFVYGYIACNRSDKGQDTINKVNDAFKNHAFKQSFLQYHLDYFGDKEAATLTQEISLMFSKFQP